MGILSDDSRSIAEIGREVLANQQEEAKTPSSVLSFDEAKDMGMLRENNETNTPNKPYNSYNDKLKEGKLYYKK